MTAEKNTTNLEFQTNVPNQSYPVQSQVSPKTSHATIMIKSMEEDYSLQTSKSPITITFSGYKESKGFLKRKRFHKWSMSSALDLLWMFPRERPRYRGIRHKERLPLRGQRTPVRNSRGDEVKIKSKRNWRVIELPQ
jgi:hypothetical protein